jgi:hypothetical protein
MYLGFFVGWAGLWVIFGRASVAAIAWACVVLGAADAAKEVWRGLKRVVPECPRLDSTDASVGKSAPTLSGTLRFSPGRGG